MALNFLRYSTNKVKAAQWEREANSDYKMLNDKFSLPLGMIKTEGADL